MNSDDQGRLSSERELVQKTSLSTAHTNYNTISSQYQDRVQEVERLIGNLNATTREKGRLNAALKEMKTSLKTVTAEKCAMSSQAREHAQ